MNTQKNHHTSEDIWWLKIKREIQGFSTNPTSSVTLINAIKFFLNYFYIFSGIWECCTDHVSHLIIKKWKSCDRKNKLVSYRFKDPGKKIKDFLKKEKSEVNPHVLTTQLKNRMGPKTHTSPTCPSPGTSVLLSPGWSTCLQS